MELEPTLTGRYRAKVTGVDRTKRKSRLSSLLQAVFVIAVFLAHRPLCHRAHNEPA